MRREPKHISPNVTRFQKSPSDFVGKQDSSAFSMQPIRAAGDEPEDCRHSCMRCILRKASLQVQPTCLSSSRPINPDKLFISFRSLLSPFNTSPTLSGLGGSRTRKIKIVHPGLWIIRAFFLPLSVKRYCLDHKLYHLPNSVVRFFISQVILGH